MSFELLFKVDVLLNDVHLELEDDDHDVIHAVSSPLSFKVVMRRLKMSEKTLLELAEDDVLVNDIAELNVVEIADDGQSVVDAAAEDGRAREKAGLRQDVSLDVELDVPRRC